MTMGSPRRCYDSRTPFERYDIGLAADTAPRAHRPVVRDAGAAHAGRTQLEVRRLAALARDGALAPSNVGGASFSIWDVGPRRIERVAPLPDPPQTAIAVGAATQRPAVVDGTSSPRETLTSVLTFDHAPSTALRRLAFSPHCARFRRPGTLL